VPLPPPWSTLQGRMVDGLLSEPRRTFVQLLEFDGEDLRGSPLTARKEVLAWLPGGWSAGIALNAHYEAEGAIVYPACSAARHRVEAPGIPVSGQPRRLLAEGQDPSSTGSHARSQGGMELVKGLLEDSSCAALIQREPGHSWRRWPPNGVEAKCPLQAVSWLLWLAAPLSGDMPARRFPRRGPHPHAD
jgi:hypothetical protein